jgi:hypothetical protein
MRGENGQSRYHDAGGYHLKEEQTIRIMVQESSVAHFTWTTPPTGDPALDVARTAVSAMASSETTCSLHRLSRTKNFQAMARLVAERFRPRK